MAHAADFCGDHLRLTSFLRVAENMPQQPPRFRRHRNKLDDQAEMISAHYGRVSSSHTSNPDRPNVGMRDSIPEPPSDLLPMQAAVRKNAVVYAAKAKTLIHPSPGLVNTRQKKRLPVTGLALVRTSTEDGLPLPGDAEAASALPIAHTDPIEDSQAISMKEGCPKGTPTPAGPSRKILLGTHRIKKIGPPGGRSTASLRRKRSKKFDVEALADGFEGLEISLLPKTSKKLSEKKNVSAVKRRKEHLINRRLQLVGGLLPQPSTAIGAPESDHSVNVPQLQLTSGPSQVARASTGALLTEVTQPSVRPIESLRTRVGQHGGSNHSIIDQLSRITAPARDDSDSDSESSKSHHDLGGEGNEDDDDGSESTDTSSPCREFESRHVGSYQVQDEHRHFAEAICHLNTTENEFWSQYGGMD